ncbi:putative secreted protein (Por secretion system target) [Dyadobacter jejuensis]|uniref:Putative secreted protein (Por secretion system target) n=1 Tax=Dyadobacter jejuensis TaxID=1082580 RepID=A0A316AQK0_9BACT|nr:T9SS type A sorting domain-containing protein [Dyadobacter jejuensis]PWJ60003.1 putative secreted protein (Por secretion system target) [Dyadobacter jejuensis]
MPILFYAVERLKGVIYDGGRVLCLLTLAFLGSVTCAMAQREIILNTTGYGFDRSAANGINADQWTYIQKFTNLSFNGQDASVTCIRLHIEWNQYEPTSGTYYGEKIAKAAEAIINLKPGMKFALLFPYQRPGYWTDSYLSQNEVAKTVKGVLVQQNIAYTCPSLYGENAKSRYLAFVNDVLNHIKPYYDKLLYVQMGNSASEEYLAPNVYINNVNYVGLYDTEATNSWRSNFLKRRFPNQEIVTWGSNSYNLDTAPQPADANWNSDIGRDFHRFASWGLLTLFKDFYKLVKSHDNNIQVLYFISDLGGGQGNVRHMHTSSVPLALELSDGVYSSDGGDQYDIWRKIAAIDVLKGSDPNKIAAIEFDPTDLGERSGEQNLEPQLATEWIHRAFEHGVDYVHLAMHFHDPQISMVAPALATSKAKYISQPFTPPARKPAIETNLFPNVFLDQYLFENWKTQGGNSWSTSDQQPVSIKMQDEGYWENIWNEEAYLPCTFVMSAPASTMLAKPGEALTLSANCQGEECDRVYINWKGTNLSNATGTTVQLTSPAQDGTYTYTAEINRSGCPQQEMAYTLNVSQAALPVTLIAFAGKEEQGQVLLSWQTTEEIHSDRFEIERMETSKQWNKIGTVLTQGDASDQTNNYHFTDFKAAMGENLYRLKMLDLDGSYAYSRLVSVKVLNSPTFAIYPNPTTGYLQINDQQSSELQSIIIYNKKGQKVLAPAVGSESSIDLSALPEDHYTLQLSYKTGQTRVAHFVKIN